MTEAPSAAVPVVLDCDPGHDDALAMALALARPELKVVGITTVAGNAELAHTTRNALSVLTLLGRTDVPVAAGADRPLRRPLRTAAHVHGTSGLEGADLPEPAIELRPEGAVELLARLIRDSAVPVTIVATGPLTNVASLLIGHPELAPRIRTICAMGGAVGEGNLTASAEFNIWVDPDAAHVVLESGLDVTLVPIDLTHQARVTLAETEQLAQLGTRTGRTLADLLRYFAAFHRERYGWDGSPVHDAVAVAHVLGLGLVGTERHRIDVETESDLTRGRTVVDLRGLSGRAPNAHLGVSIDRDAFVSLLLAAVGRYP